MAAFLYKRLFSQASPGGWSRSGMAPEGGLLLQRLLPLLHPKPPPVNLFPMLVWNEKSLRLSPLPKENNTLLDTSSISLILLFATTEQKLTSKFLRCSRFDFDFHHKWVKEITQLLFWTAQNIKTETSETRKRVRAFVPRVNPQRTGSFAAAGMPASIIRFSSCLFFSNPVRVRVHAHLSVPFSLL